MLTGKFVVASRNITLRFQFQVRHGVCIARAHWLSSLELLHGVTPCHVDFQVRHGVYQTRSRTVTLTFRFITVSVSHGVTPCNVDFQVYHGVCITGSPALSR